MDLPLLKDLLVNKNLLSELLFFEELSSTNSFSKKNDPPDNTLVLTSHQTGGVGRFGRSWNSSKNKNLTFTLVKCFKVSIDEIHLINFYSSYILFLTLKGFLNEINADAEADITLKWPNDILLNGKKVAGILLEVRDLKKKEKKFIIGIGLNVNQEKFSGDISDKATSLLNETGKPASSEKILTAFVKNYFANLKLVYEKTDLMNLWVENSRLMGKEIMFRQVEDDTEKKATVINIDNDGGLRVKFHDGQVSKFYSGEISMSL